MAREFEIKLQLSSETAERVFALPWLRELASGPAKTEKLVSVYFDTNKGKLRAHGLSLRVRHLGDKCVQTIKLEDNGQRGRFGRDEWEQDIALDRPDLNLAAGTALESLSGHKLRRKLRPMFETVIERTSMPIRCDGAAFEFALDQGLIHSDERCQTVNEIEIEIKEGDPSALAPLAAGDLRRPIKGGARLRVMRWQNRTAGTRRTNFT